MLVDPDGNVVYTAYKGVDLGTNLLTGPYKDSGLERPTASVLRTNTVNASAFTDFEPYAPSYNVPTAFALSPIGVDGKLAGVLVVQLPSTAINNVMTSNGQWSQTGLGQSGESLPRRAGPDDAVDVPAAEEDPEAYRAAVVSQGTPPAGGGPDRGGQEPDPAPGRRLARGDSRRCAAQTGTAVETDYLGRRVLTVVRADRRWTASTGR